jgi:hypothetical protein
MTGGDVFPDWSRWRDGLDILIPALPRGFDAWETMVTVALLVTLKLLRAYFMKRRSTYVDRFGWALIVFDVVFALFFLTTLVWTLYPGLRPDTAWAGRSLITSVLVVTTWQLLEILLAPFARVDAAVSGSVAPLDAPPPGKERRVYDRRQETRDMKAELRRYQEGTN